MAFNSLHFFLFFIIVYAIYLAVKDYKRQNWVLLAASYLFYAAWDWRFLSLILVSTIVNFYSGIFIEAERSETRRRNIFIGNIVFNLGLLGFFKYFNFFGPSLNVFLATFGIHASNTAFNIVLPLGISFYTFQVMSYPIDIYWRRISATKKIPEFALFVAFFPLIVSGPIERARNLIPQIENKRSITLDKFYGGSWLIFWGLYKKIVIADNLSRITTAVFARPEDFPSVMMLIAMYAFTFQIYADFSGYSDMARGLSRLMGFDIMLNFRAPFFSRNIYELWQRWHISLTTWIKEYVYYPLALVKFFGRQLNARLVIMITWVVMGIWHGPSIKFVVWGLYHGIVLVIYNKIRPFLLAIKPKDRMLRGILTVLSTLLVFHIFCVGLILFGVKSLSDFFTILDGALFSFIILHKFVVYIMGLFIILICPLLIIEYFQYKKDDELVIFKWPPVIQGIIFYILLYILIMHGDFSVQKYYYFQF